MFVALVYENTVNLWLLHGRLPTTLPNKQDFSTWAAKRKAVLWNESIIDHTVCFIQQLERLHLRRGNKMGCGSLETLQRVLTLTPNLREQQVDAGLCAWVQSGRSEQPGSSQEIGRHALSSAQPSRGLPQPASTWERLSDWSPMYLLLCIAVDDECALLAGQLLPRLPGDGTDEVLFVLEVD